MNKAAFVEALNHLEHTPFVRDSNQQSIQSDDFFWECNETNLASTSDGGNNEFVDRVNASEIFDACLEEGVGGKSGEGWVEGYKRWERVGERGRGGRDKWEECGGVDGKSEEGWVGRVRRGE